MADVLDAPLVLIGADTSERRSIFVYMHEGYDYPRRANIDLAVNSARSLAPGFYHVVGNLSNPMAWWPSYVMVTMRDG